MNADLNVLLAIVAIGVAVYGTRLAGFWLLQGRKIEGRAKAALDALPPAILMAVIAPAVFMQGNAERIAAALTLAAALMRLPLLLVIAVGVGSVALLRMWIT